MYPAFSVDLQFWFCENANDVPCRLLTQALFDEQYPFRLSVVMMTFMFLAITELVYYVCCAIVPSMIGMRVPSSDLQEVLHLVNDDSSSRDTSNNPESSLSSNQQEHSIPTTLRQVKQSWESIVALSEGSWDYHIYSKLKNKKNDVDDEDEKKSPLFDGTMMLLCVICLCHYQSGDVIIRSTRCRHNFHGTCLAMWLRRQPICPCCRRPMDPPPLVVGREEATN